MPGPHLLSADDLVAWADSIDAESGLPELMCKLIRLDSISPTRIGARTGKGIHLAGADIEVSTEFESNHVPKGLSVWELSTNKSPAEKAEADFVKATGDIPEERRQEFTFVGVTLRRWAGKNDWIKSKSGAGWRGVRYLDADDIYEWLQSCLPAHFWLSIRGGRNVCSIRLLGEWWQHWASLTNPVFGTDWLLAGRSQETEAIRTFAGNSKALGIHSRSEAESLAFLASALLTSGQEQDHQLLERVLVVESLEGLQYLSNVGRDLVFVVKCDVDESHIGQALQNNRIVLLQNSSITDRIELPLMNVRKLVDTLQTSGLSGEVAWEAAPKARNSIEHFRQHLGAPTVFFREIAESETELTKLSAALLTNRWDEEREADRLALAKLAGCSYEQFREWIVGLPQGILPLIRRVGSVWFLTDSSEAWRQFSKTVAPATVTSFIELAISILGEEDPAFSMEPDQRWTAALYGKSQQYSGHLKTGITNSITLLAVQDPEFTPALSGQLLATDLVQQLLAGATESKWYAISPFLPVLAESAPEAFLNAIEAELSTKGNLPFKELVGSGSFLTNDDRICHLLWSLERLAWSPEFLPRAALALAAISDLDLARSGNNPERSLKEIFLPWHPCTSANLHERIAVLDLLRRKHPKASWQVLISQLPGAESSAMQTSRPEVRDWAADGVKPQSRSDISQAGIEALRRLVEDAGTDSGRWFELVEHALGLKGDWGTDTLASLQLACMSMVEGERVSLWQKLSKLYRDHVRYPDSEWSMDAPMRKRFEEVLLHIAPTDRVEKHCWLFDQWVELPEPWKEDAHDYDADRLEVENLRKSALKEILEESGIDGIFRLAALVEAPGYVGRVCADLDIWDEVSERLLLSQYLLSEEPGLNGLTYGYALRRFEQKGMDWLLGLVKDGDLLSRDQKATMFLVAPAIQETWKELDACGMDIAATYWRRISSWAISDGGEQFEAAMEKLLAAGRAADVIDLLAMYRLDPKKLLPSELSLHAFESIKDHLGDYKDCLGKIRDDMGRVIDRLATDPLIDIPRLARIEFFFTPILNILRSPAALGRALAEEPETLIELVSMAYRKEGEEPQDLPDQTVQLAAAAHRILENWRQLPGFREGTQIDGGVLMSYVKQARLLAGSAEVLRLRPVDSILGKLLSYSPPDEDGSWPHVSVREVIESIDSESFANGFVIGLRNQRGVYGKDPASGGKAERDLKTTYSEFAKRVRATHPKTASLLTRIAEAFGWDAKREDVRADMYQDLR